MVPYMTLYAVTGTATYYPKGKQGRIMQQIPTFYLDAATQGIVDEKHAERIARDIVCPMSDCKGHTEVSFHVTKIVINLKE